MKESKRNFPSISAVQPSQNIFCQPHLGLHNKMIPCIVALCSGDDTWLIMMLLQLWSALVNSSKGYCCQAIVHWSSMYQRKQKQWSPGCHVCCLHFPGNVMITWQIKSKDSLIRLWSCKEICNVNKVASSQAWLGQVEHNYLNKKKM